MACADGKPAVMFDDVAVPATPGKEANVFQVDTKLLMPRT